MPEHSSEVYLERMSKDMKLIREMMTTVVTYMRDAESECSEERCDDRYRQLLEEAHTDGGTFEKVRRGMAEDPANRWDHTRQLSKSKENGV